MTTDKKTPADNGKLLLEHLTEGFGHFVRAGRTLHTGQTPYQKIELFDTPDFGKLLRLDNVFQTSVGDEFYYHEMMVHPAMMAHDNPERVLIIGAGDGGMAEEVLKHNCVRQVVMVEIDPEVVRFSKAHLGEIHHGAFDDPRLELIIADGFEWVMEAQERGARFDVVICDLTDPIGPSRPLYTVEFFTAIATLLGKAGIQVQHIETPVIRQPLFRQLVANLEAVYAQVHPLFQYVPLYGTLWSFCTASQCLNPAVADPAEMDARVQARRVTNLKIYNGEVHRAAFAQPNFVRELLATRAEPIHLHQLDRFDEIAALAKP